MNTFEPVRTFYGFSFAFAQTHFHSLTHSLARNHIAINNSQRKIKNKLCARLLTWTRCCHKATEKDGEKSEQKSSVSHQSECTLRLLDCVFNEAVKRNGKRRFSYGPRYDPLLSLSFSRERVHTTHPQFSRCWNSYSYSYRNLLGEVLCICLLQMINHRCGKIKWLFFVFVRV